VATRSPHRLHANAARAAGVLFVLGVLTSLLASALVGSSADPGASVGHLANEEGRVLTSAILQLMTAAGALGIAVALFPAVRSYSATLAAGAVAFRAVEAAFAALSALCLLGLLVISRAPASDGTLWSVLASLRDASNFVLSVFFFAIGAGHYLTGLHRARLLPRWLTVWGFAGVALVLAAAAIAMYRGQPFAISGGLTLLALPIAAQEIVLGVWLLRVGFQAPLPIVGDRHRGRQYA
jgi:hypothetical protein